MGEMSMVWVTIGLWCAAIVVIAISSGNSGES